MMRKKEGPLFFRMFKANEVKSICLGTTQLRLSPLAFKNIIVDISLKQERLFLVSMAERINKVHCSN
jgi:uncharacterized protein (UPF0303 family)